MAEDQVAESTKGVDSKMVKEAEELIMSVLMDAENGDEERRKILNEIPDTMLGVLALGGDFDFLLRLAKYYCLSTKTAIKANTICTCIREKDNSWARSEKASDFINISKLSIVLPYASNDQDREDPKVQDARTIIHDLAKQGLALAQYWIGRILDDTDRREWYYKRPDYLGWSINWHQMAADQGVVDAQKRLPALLQRRKQEAENRAKKVAESRRNGGECVYCGGTFKGIFKKVCQACGKPKNY